MAQDKYFQLWVSEAPRRCFRSQQVRNFMEWVPNSWGTATYSNTCYWEYAQSQLMRWLETRSADCCTCSSWSTAPIPSLGESCRLVLFCSTYCSQGAEGGRRKDQYSECLFSLFLNPKVETCLGNYTSSGGGCLCLFFFFSFPFIFLMRWMAEVFCCELGKNCQFRWSTDSISSLCIRFFFNKQQLTAEGRAPSIGTGTPLKPVCLFSISPIPAVFDKTVPSPAGVLVQRMQELGFLLHFCGCCFELRGT